jgi:hypothetical protein
MDKPRAGLNQRIFAWAMARFNGRYEQFAARHKERPQIAGVAMKAIGSRGVR